MTFLDFFAGVGGFRLGMQAAGHKCLGHCEIDRHANNSYTAMHLLADKDIETYMRLDIKTAQKYLEGYIHDEWQAGDITQVRARDVPKADCWCFGFPCQDISTAGRQAGLNAGGRSGLFYAVTGLLRETPEKDRPAYLLVENVKNLLSINNGYDFLDLLVELEQVGYDAEWCVLDTADVLPQHRERVYVVGHLRGRRTAQVFPICRQDRAPDADNRPALRQVNTSVQYAKDNVYLTDGIAPTLMASDYKRGGVKVKPRGGLKAYGLNSQQSEGFFRGALPDCSRALRANKHDASVMVVGASDEPYIRKLTPRECFRLQGIPDELYDRAGVCCSDSQLYKQAGNSVSAPVVEAIARRMIILDRRADNG